MTTLTEAAKLGSKTGKRWRCRLLGVGAGLNRYYPEDVLEAAARDKVFPKGTLVHMDHPTEQERKERPERSATTVIGALAEDAEFVPGDGLYAPIEFIDSYSAFVQETKDMLGLSVNARGQVSEDFIDGKPIVALLEASPLNTVDIVTIPAQRGKIIELLESYDIMALDDEKSRKDKGMTPEEITAVAEAVATKLSDTLVPAITEALKPTPPAEDENKVTTAEVAEAVIAAELPKAARDVVFAQVDAGVELTEAITSQKTYIDSLMESFKDESTPGFQRMASKPSDFDPSLSIWSK